MGILKRKPKDEDKGQNLIPDPPKLVSRRENRKSTLVSGRTIGERRERLETASERAAIREKAKKKQARRIVTTVLIYVLIATGAIFAGIKLFSPRPEAEQVSPSKTIVVPYAPTIQVIDEAASNNSSNGSSNDKITSRMKEYIGQAEADFRELGYEPIKAVLPKGAIREVDFYLKGYNGFIKLITDRGTGVSVEDVDRMIRYLASIGVQDFQYIDVRIDGKAYWK